ncbi:multi-sensor signal transduction histidine kinase [Halanaeroarchaeum sulfurireducens]|uniref:histidine kinase n=1 Tax=Halanaeroarchaeum sulfurireducens TaxID=1604004 RepID=A0A0F7PC90_9EURY|nr:multi-sensor signal transduction histidine kinase [Halanaeroarchaeum sulfurireducens]ALG81369.1 multi-sensor signal transduction histidine kinase [Halanaeroarchaeum sulfurireducens]
MVATYTAFLLSLEHSYPEPNQYLLLNAMAIGAMINFVYGYQYVRIQRSRRQLESRTNRLVTIASMVSHDLRNPLNVALGRAELVEEREGDVEGMGSLKQALRRIESLTEELLVIARGEPDEDDTATVSLESVAREAWQVVESPDIELTVRTDGRVTACPDKLHHLLENLFRNAIEHGETTGAIAVGALEGGEGFYVADDGRGIAPDLRESILSHGFTTSEEGTGLGLYIVEEIAEAHGWEIRVTESADGGARFEFADVEFER